MNEMLPPGILLFFCTQEAEDFALIVLNGNAVHLGNL